MTSNLDRKTTILDSVLDQVGQTPCIRLNTVPAMLGLKCEVIAKCEFLNPGGSVKDRIGRMMVLNAEKDGKIKPGDTLVEASSGNTGIGMSMAAAARGYKMIVTMPVKMSQEKSRVLTVLGTKVIRTPTAAASADPDSLISVAKRIAKENDDHHMLDQYVNQANPDAHYFGTGQEILDQCGGKVDMVVIGCGTGGTMSGIAKMLKEKIPGVKVVGVDPVGSILADPKVAPPANYSYQVEGIGYDFIPEVCDRSLVDQWIKTEDPLAFKYARMLQRHEGMLVGGSSGSAMAGVVAAAKDLGADKRVVVIFADNIRNYMSKFADDNWMVEKGFLPGPLDFPVPTYDAVKKERDELAEKVKALEAKLEASAQ
jgi:cystathionine beta-synthase